MAVFREGVAAGAGPSGSEPASAGTAQSDIEEDRMTRWLGVIFMAVILGVALNAPAYAQAPKPEETKPAETKPAETKPVEAKPEEKKEEKPKTLWEENILFAYIENSGVWNLGPTSRSNHNSGSGGAAVSPGVARSEERRVGKECRL